MVRFGSSTGYVYFRYRRSLSAGWLAAAKIIIAAKANASTLTISLSLILLYFWENYSSSMTVNCPLDFDSELWSGFDTAMAQEWNVTVTTSCHESERFPSTLREYGDLAETVMAERENLTAIASVTAYIDLLLAQGDHEQQVVFLTEHSQQVFQKPLASGVAYPSENLAFVENNFGYSTASLSHEILHLVLEEQEHEKSRYVDMVHENQLKYELMQMCDNKRPVIKKD